MKTFQVAIVGGGLAGLTAAIHLCREGLDVVLFEKNQFPHHKVCGEYLSNEALPYLQSLGINLEEVGPMKINRLLFSTQSGKSVETELPLGGIGISRYALDELLYRKTLKEGAQIEISTVENITKQGDTFLIKTSNTDFQAEVVLGAYGKRSHLDKQLHRNFVTEKSEWLAVKNHYESPEFPSDLVGLHSFDGGYCGLSTTETGAVNCCYLTSYKSFQHHKDIDTFNKNVLAKNTFLKEFLLRSKPLFEKPLSIAQVSFQQKNRVEQHIIMCGDAAGLIHPLCGNGMAMAMHSAKIASETVLIYFGFENRNRQWLETNYAYHWKKNFGKRLSAGNKLQSLLLHPKLSDIALTVLSKNPKWMKKIIEKTHGKPF